MDVQDACSGLFHPQRICILGASLSRWQWEDLPTKRQRPPPSVANRRTVCASCLFQKQNTKKMSLRKGKSYQKHIYNSWGYRECWQYMRYHFPSSAFWLRQLLPHPARHVKYFPRARCAHNAHLTRSPQGLLCKLFHPPSG